MDLNSLFGKGCYEVRTKCSNCKTIQITKIKKGNKAEEVITNGACENCGCQTLEIQYQHGNNR